MIIDAHSHLSPPPKEKSIWTNPRFSYYNIDEWVNFKDKCGIDKSVVFGKNKYVLKAYEKYPKKIVPWMSVNPKENKPEDFEEGVRNGFKGMKLHPRGDGFKAYDTNLLGPFMEALERHDMPVLIHSDPASTNSNPFYIAELARVYPDVTVIMGHMGMVYDTVDAIYIAPRYPNLILETSTHVGSGRVLQAVEAVGAERVVFGSDFPASHPLVEMKKIEVVELPKEQEKLVMGENMAKILKII
jgi:predicted TIM-barrel fold metal-dependent hydrolase